jgi:hypothetical protein
MFVDLFQQFKSTVSFQINKCATVKFYIHHVKGQTARKADNPTVFCELIF